MGRRRVTEGTPRREILPRPHDGLQPGQWRLDEIPEGFVLTIRPGRRGLFGLNVAWGVFWTIACFAVSITATWSFAGASSLLMGAVLALLFATPGITTAISLATVRVILAVDGPTALLMASPSPWPAVNYRTSHLDSLRSEPSLGDVWSAEINALRTYGRAVHVDAYGPLTFDGFGESPRFGGDISLATADGIAKAVRQRLTTLEGRQHEAAAAGAGLQTESG
jgi:hypothetical protein